MIILQVQQLTKYFGAELILSNIKLEVQHRDRIALVGRNGAGKSTLLKMIAGHMSYDSGQVIAPKDLSIGYLAQHTGLESDKSIWDEMLTVYSDLILMEKQIRSLETQMSDPAVYEQTEKYQRILTEYDQLQIKFKEAGGYQYEANIRSILHGLQFQSFDYSTKIATLSGGQKTRLALAKLLLVAPDLLILDEPTNHLDIETLSWLEQYLQSYQGAILIVSHDRYFLDKIVTQVYELSRQLIRKYPGNYSTYLDRKAEQYEKDIKEYEKQQDEVAKLQAFIQKNLARASTTKRAQSRRKQLNRMEMMDRPAGDEKSANFSFDIDRQSGNDVLKLNDVSIGYDESLSTNISMHVQRGDSVAILGPNGVGKTTLLKSILDQIPILSGSVNFGSNVSIGFYDQEQAALTSNQSVLQELWNEDATKTEKEIRTILGNFLFSGDDVLKPVSALSGGEKARLALSKLMMKKANLLILDEPTNHLDLDSKEVLENALVDYPGTIMFVSHDRYFINRIATKVIVLSKEGAIEYLGDYDYYQQKEQEKLELAALEETKISTVETVTTSRQSYIQDKEAKKLERQRIRKLEEIEQRIEQLEQDIADAEQQLYTPEITTDYERAAEIQQILSSKQAELDKFLEEWTQLQDS